MHLTESNKYLGFLLEDPYRNRDTRTEGLIKFLVIALFINTIFH